MCLCLNPKRKWNLLLDGLHSPIVSSKLRSCLDESWPVILQALALDTVPVNSEGNDCSKASVANTQKHGVTTCQYSMVELKFEDFKFLWGFSLLGLFQSQHPIISRPIIQLAFVNAEHDGNLPTNEVKPSGLTLHEIVLPMFQFLSTESFFGAGLLNMDICKELLQILSYSTYMDTSWNSLAILVLSQVAQNCPQEIFDTGSFALIAMELCLHYLFKVYQSTDTISVSRPNSEVSVIHTLCSTTKAVINRIETKMHKHSKSVVLALILMGYKCVREASTEVYLSEAINMVNCTTPLLKRIIDDEAVLDDSILSLRDMFETCLGVVAALTKYCMEGFHLQEVKSFKERKLIHAKLAFSFEQIILIAILALESNYVEDCEASKSICLTALRYCVRCFQTALCDSNMQVQVIGLQFLKARIQRGVNTEDNSFLMFLIGELIPDIFTLIYKMLKNTVTRESTNIASECLSLMVVLQTHAKGNDCQISFMTLLLEAIVMIFLSTRDGFSPEVSDLRSTAIKLVSRLAQIPSSAVHFKDVLLSMPPLHRQQLQGVIRASVTHDTNQTEHKVPVLDIKMPKPLGGNEVKLPAPSATAMQPDEINKEKDEDSEDDWDAFQSFPVSRNEAGDESKTENSAESKDVILVESSSDMEGSIGDFEFQECSISKSIDIEKEIKSDECVEAFEERHDQTNHGASEPHVNENQEMEKELQSSGLQEEASPIPGNEVVSCDQKPEVEAAGLIKEDMPVVVSAGDVVFEECCISKSNGSGNEMKSAECLEAFTEKHDQTNHGASEPHVNEHQEMEEELRSSGLQEEASPIAGNDPVSCDQKTEVEAEVSIKVDMPELVSVGDTDFQEGCISKSIDSGKDMKSAERLEAFKEKHDQTNYDASEPHVNDHQEMEEELRSSEEASPIPGNEPVSCDLQPEVEAGGSIKEDMPELVSVGDAEFQECCISKSIDSVKEMKSDESLEAEKEKHDQASSGAIEPHDNDQEMEEEMQSSGLQEEASSIEGNELVSCDGKPEVKAEGSIKEDMPEQVVSDSRALQQGFFESDKNEQCNRCDGEDGKNDGVNENESRDSQKGMSGSPVESEHNSTKLEQFAEDHKE